MKSLLQKPTFNLITMFVLIIALFNKLKGLNHVLNERITAQSGYDLGYQYGHKTGYFTITLVLTFAIVQKWMKLNGKSILSI